VYLSSPSSFASKKGINVKGRIQNEHCNMIETLLEDGSIDLQVACIPEAQTHCPKKKGRNLLMLPCTLEITIYGPLDLFEEIGQWFQDCEVYLQDPDKCPRDTKYCNPQRISSYDLSSCPMVSEVVSRSLVLVPTEIPAPPDFLDILSSQFELEETPQPSIIRANLKKSVISISRAYAILYLHESDIKCRP
jgi:SWI/SNF-related matrix-associated actin-dependent regulator of chromatin subfamily A3